MTVARLDTAWRRYFGACGENFRQLFPECRISRVTATNKRAPGVNRALRSGQIPAAAARLSAHLGARVYCSARDLGELAARL